MKTTQVKCIFSLHFISSFFGHSEKYELEINCVANEQSIVFSLNVSAVSFLCSGRFISFHFTKDVFLSIYSNPVMTICSMVMVQIITGITDNS